MTVVHILAVSAVLLQKVVSKILIFLQAVQRLLHLEFPGPLFGLYVYIQCVVCVHGVWYVWIVVALYTCERERKKHQLLTTFISLKWLLPA